MKKKSLKSIILSIGMERIILILVIILAFLTGVLSSYAFEAVGNYTYFEKPFSFALINERGQPSNWIDENDILLLDDKIIINIDNSLISSYEATGSMLPTLGENANGIEVKPESADQIDIGDIISFKKDNYLVVHRVIDKGVDEKGTYFITRGDNNSISDGKIYFEDIEYVTVGLIF